MYQRRSGYSSGSSRGGGAGWEQYNTQYEGYGNNGASRYEGYGDDQQEQYNDYNDYPEEYGNQRGGAAGYNRKRPRPDDFEGAPPRRRALLRAPTSGSAARMRGGDLYGNNGGYDDAMGYGRGGDGYDQEEEYDQHHGYQQEQQGPPAGYYRDLQGLGRRDLEALAGYEESYPADEQYGEQYDKSAPEYYQQLAEQARAESKKQKKKKAELVKPAVQETKKVKKPKKNRQTTVLENAIVKAHKNAMISTEKRKDIVESIQEVMATITRAARKIVHERNPQIFSENAEVVAAAKEKEAEAASKKASSNNGAAPSNSTGGILSMLRKSAGVSDKPASGEKKEQLAGLAKKNKQIPEQIFMGAIRCGNCIMRLLCQGSNMKEIVVILTKNIPTKRIMDDMFRHLSHLLSLDTTKKTYELLKNEQDEMIHIKVYGVSNFEMEIRFSSPLVSDQFKSENKYAVDNGRALDLQEGEPAEEECLSREKCLEALSLIRRVRWFNNEVMKSLTELTLIRVLIDLSSKKPGWDVLTPYMLSVVVHLAKVSGNTVLKNEHTEDEDYEDFDVRLDFLLIRCLHILSSGILLPSGRGLKDPCETDVDLTAVLSVQEAESVTCSAQHELRKFSFFENFTKEQQDVIFM